jgi:hypothetical protein
MSSRSEAELSETVQQCVLECVKAANPPHFIREFAQRLVNEHGWMQADADEVADSAARVLHTVGPHMSPPDGQS